MLHSYKTNYDSLIYSNTGVYYMPGDVLGPGGMPVSGADTVLVHKFTFTTTLTLPASMPVWPALKGLSTSPASGKLPLGKSISSSNTSLTSVTQNQKSNLFLSNTVHMAIMKSL